MYQNRNRSKPPKDIPQIRKDLERHFQPHALADLLRLHQMVNPHPVFNKLEELVEKNVRGISSTQLRKLFDLVKNAKTRQALLIQRPQFAHMIAKTAGSRETRESAMAKNIMLLVDEVAAQAGQDDVLFLGFSFFATTLIAFHKYHETLHKKWLKPEKIRADVSRALGALRPLDFFNWQNAKHTDVVIDQLQQFIRANVTGITATQLRNVYGKILDEASRGKLAQMRPVLAYTAARQEREESQKLIFFIQSLLRQISHEAHQKAFVQLMERVVAIHKFEEVVRKKRIKIADLTRSIEKHFEPHWKSLIATDIPSAYGAIQAKIKTFVQPERGEGIKAAQFRRLYDQIMEAKMVNDLKLLRPILLYAFARQNSAEARKIIYLLSHLIKKVTTPKHLLTYQFLVEDLLAYHRYLAETSTGVSILNQ
ncbi:MAG: type III-A CRISPR-associated protein Csm2 [Bacteroidota bacterium]